MFWKKSHNKSNEVKLFEIPEDNRDHFRVVPSIDDPIDLTLDNKRVSLIDISTGGFQCKNNNFTLGNIYSFYLYLPDNELKIYGKVQVLEITKRNLCRCQFTMLDPKFEDRISRYALNRQKEELQNRHRRRKIY